MSGEDDLADKLRGRMTFREARTARDDLFIRDSQFFYGYTNEEYSKQRFFEVTGWTFEEFTERQNEYGKRRRHF